MKNVKKSNEELRVVYAEVYAPNRVDSDGDFMSESEIQKMAWNFMSKGYNRNIDLEHNGKPCGAWIVESFIADQPPFIKGSWVIGVHVPDEGLWEAVKAGEYNGFSLAGKSMVESKKVEIIIPDVLKGKTTSAKMNGVDHEHEFRIFYNEAGEMIGGFTNTVKGHIHTITTGTITERSEEHRHRFSSVDNLEVIVV